MIFAAPRPIQSPCVGLCELGAEGYCVGCWRTGDEIARWIGMSDTERRHVMENVLPAREAAHGAANPAASAATKRGSDSR
jgi:uncharacterized protein